MKDCCEKCKYKDGPGTYCSNRSCPCHSALSQDWEKEFDDLVADQDGRDFVDSSLRISILKAFITRLLSTQRKELLRELEEVKADYKTRKRDTPFQDTLFNHAANVLDEVLARLAEGDK